MYIKYFKYCINEYDALYEINIIINIIWEKNVSTFTKNKAVHLKYIFV